MKWSRRQLKIGFWSSIGLIVIGFIVISLQHHIPIQFTSEIARSNFRNILLMLIPITLFIAMALHYLLGNSRDLPILRIFFGIILGTILLVSASVLSFFSPQWSDVGLLYRGRFTEKEIILQNDGWSYKDRIVKVTPLIFGLRYITPIDTMNLPENKWVKLKTTSNR